MAHTVLLHCPISAEIRTVDNYDKYELHMTLIILPAKLWQIWPHEDAKQKPLWVNFPYKVNDTHNIGTFRLLKIRWVLRMGNILHVTVHD